MDGREDDAGRRVLGCNVNSTLNFGIGVVAIVAAALIAYFVWHRLL